VQRTGQPVKLAPQGFVPPAAISGTHIDPYFTTHERPSIRRHLEVLRCPHASKRRLPEGQSEIGIWPVSISRSWPRYTYTDIRPADGPLVNLICGRGSVHQFYARHCSYYTSCSSTTSVRISRGRRLSYRLGINQGRKSLQSIGIGPDPGEPTFVPKSKQATIRVRATRSDFDR